MKALTRTSYVLPGAMLYEDAGTVATMGVPVASVCEEAAVLVQPVHTATPEADMEVAVDTVAVALSV